jgi:hypothetical protein
LDTKCGHAKIEITFAQPLITTIFQQLNLSDVMEDKQKFIQFAIVFNLLTKGKPMTSHEDFKPLFKFLKFNLSPNNISLIRVVGK